MSAVVSVVPAVVSVGSAVVSVVVSVAPVVAAVVYAVAAVVSVVSAVASAVSVFGVYEYPYISVLDSVGVSFDSVQLAVYKAAVVAPRFLAVVVTFSCYYIAPIDIDLHISPDSFHSHFYPCLR